MREIKLRVWDKQAKKMYEPVVHIYFKPANMGYIIPLPDSDYGLTEENSILMQYTGVRDFLDHKLYEGDIVKVRDDTYLAYYEIRWTDCHFEIHTEEDGYGNPDTDLLEDWKCTVKNTMVEKIGNIYETPELLRV